MPPHLGRASSAEIRLRPEARVGEREGEDPLLEVGADLVGHPRRAGAL